jgi:hypothetical protein
VVYLIEMACQIGTTGLFYDLLKPAGRSVSLLAAFLGLTGVKRENCVPYSRLAALKVMF